MKRKQQTKRDVYTLKESVREQILADLDNISETAEEFVERVKKENRK